MYNLPKSGEKGAIKRERERERERELCSGCGV
jgi:hypothetical protein